MKVRSDVPGTTAGGGNCSSVCAFAGRVGIGAPVAICTTGATILVCNKEVMGTSALFCQAKNTPKSRPKTMADVKVLRVSHLRLCLAVDHSTTGSHRLELNFGR